VLPELPFSRLAGFTTTLSRRRGRDLPADVWEMGPNGNASDRLSYASEITTPDGARPDRRGDDDAATAVTSSAVIICAEVRVEAFDA
jgi:hypothetical protein